MCTMPPCHLSQLHANAPRGTGETRGRFDRMEFRDSSGAFGYRVGQEARVFYSFSVDDAESNEDAAVDQHIPGMRARCRS
jgi:hypothetical protein